MFVRVCCWCHKPSRVAVCNFPRMLRLCKKIPGKGWLAHQPRFVSTTSCSNDTFCSNDSSAKAADVNTRRVVGIMAHIDAGKTTTTERMLYYSGFQETLGEVHHGDTTMDFLALERERGITIQTAAVTFPWRGHTVSLVDTPGHVDFTIEVERAIRVADGAVAVLDASAGVEAQTVTVWQQADRYSVPRLCYLNKMDKPTASHELCLHQIRHKLQANPLLLQIPIGLGKDFSGVVDLISGRKVEWDRKDDRDRGATYRVSAEAVTAASDPALYPGYCEARAQLCDVLGDLDAAVADHILQSESMDTVPHNLLHDAVRRATLAQDCVPVLLGSSYRNTGVQLLMDSILRYLPTPTDRLPAAVQLYNGSLCALAFKIVHDAQRGGLLTYVRVYSGTLDKSSKVYNVSRQVMERPTKLFMALADDLQPVQSAGAGSIVVLTGLQKTSTGDTLVGSKQDVEMARRRLKRTSTAAQPAGPSLAAQEQDEGSSDSDEDGEGLVEQNQHLLVGVKVPEPVFFCSVEAVSLSQQKPLEDALAILQREDPSVRVRHDPETDQTVLAGMGELHLEVVADRLRTQHNVEAELGPLQVAYREQIVSSAEQTFTLDKVIGGSRQCATVTLCLDPEPGHVFKRLLFRHTKDNGENLSSIRRPQLNALTKGVSSALSCGPVLSCPVHGTAVHLKYFTTTRSTSLAFVAATAGQCVKQLLLAADCRLSEPIMLLSVVADADHAHSLLADLNKRKADVVDVYVRLGTKHVTAHVPLANMVGYSSEVRRLASGRASFSMELLEYRIMDPVQQREAVKSVTGFYTS